MSQSAVPASLAQYWRRKPTAYPLLEASGVELVANRPTRPTTNLIPDEVRRESLLTKTFVDIADNLVKDYDVVDMLHILAARCVEIFGVSQAGIMLKNEDGSFSAVASSSEGARAMDLLQLQNQAGPCWQAVESGAPVHVADLEAVAGRWPEYVEKGLELGLRSIDALPIRFRDQSLGALNLFRETEGGSASEDLSAIQALADVAAISLLQTRHAADAEDTLDHLQIALDSRVAIEQAKGIVSNSLQVDLNEAFRLLREFARHHNLKLTNVCLSVIEGRVAPPDLR